MPRKSKELPQETQADATASAPVKKKRARRKPRPAAAETPQQQTATAAAPAQQVATQAGPLPAHGIVLGKRSKYEVLDFKFGNRHGLVTGATGTGKTVTLQVLAEGFSRAGVPVFAADVKGDLSGIAAIGEPKEGLLKRANEIGLPYEPENFPVVFWDLFGEQGHPVRATIT